MVQNPDTDRLHPDSTHDAKYPYNHMVRWDNGTEFHIDTTPGKGRIRLAHGVGGSYFEINEDGRWVEMSTNKKNSYVKGGLASTVDGNVNEKTGGSHRSSVQGDMHEEYQGKHTNFVGGDKSSIVSGDHTSATAGDSVHGTKGKFVHKIGGGTQIKLDGDDSNQKQANLICDPTANVQFGKDMGQYVKGNFQANSGAPRPCLPRGP
jgi:hypothetical protein